MWPHPQVSVTLIKVKLLVCRDRKDPCAFDNNSFLVISRKAPKHGFTSLNRQAKPMRDTVWKFQVRGGLRCIMLLMRISYMICSVGGSRKGICKAASQKNWHPQWEADVLSHCPGGNPQTWKIPVWSVTEAIFGTVLEWGHKDPSSGPGHSCKKLGLVTHICMPIP